MSRRDTCSGDSFADSDPLPAAKRAFFAESLQMERVTRSSKRRAPPQRAQRLPNAWQRPDGRAAGLGVAPPAEATRGGRRGPGVRRTRRPVLLYTVTSCVRREVARGEGDGGRGPTVRAQASPGALSDRARRCKGRRVRREGCDAVRARSLTRSCGGAPARPGRPRAGACAPVLRNPRPSSRPRPSRGWTPRGRGCRSSATRAWRRGTRPRC